MKVQDTPPLSETSFFILLSLAISPKHGYAIMKEIEAMSEQRVILATGTLYSALRRMLEDGWIERLNNFPPDGDLPERKLYQLSDLGRRILEAESGRLQNLAGLTHLKDVKVGR